MPSTDRSRNDTLIRALTAAVVLGAQLASIVPAAADGVDLAGELIAPNVMLIVDISGGMGESVPMNLYVSTRRYPVQRRCESPAKQGKTTAAQPCASGAVFKGSPHVRYAESPAALTGSGAVEARAALAESGHWSGAIQGRHVTLYTGNYVNYLAGSCASGGACPESKLTSVKRIIGSAVDSVRGLRFGIMTFHYGAHGARGGRVIAPVGSERSVIKDAVNALAPARDAPLGDALYDAGQYFKGEPLTSGAAGASPIERGCQPNHVVLITGGMQTSGARSLVAEATRRQNEDHARSFPELQRVSVHTLAFGPAGGAVSSAADRIVAELKQAAEDGGGSFAQAATAKDLETSLRLTLARITDATYSLTNPVLPTATTTAVGRRAYVASFQPSVPFWRGSLQAYQRDAHGVVPVDAQGVPLASALIWDAGSVLSRLAPASRTLYTEIGGRLTPFTRSNSALTRAMLGVASASERDRVIEIVRGGRANVDSRAGAAAPDRPWKLGAIVHSTPVLVSAPTLALNDPSYRAFKAAQTKRTTVLIVGANDGMLHAFREKDGVELWAFVPPDMLGRLRALTAADGTPAAFVDGSPIAADIKVAGTWKTIVIFGGRRGSASYYALDITETTAPNFLWRFSDPKLANTWSQPAIGKVKLGGADNYVAFVGGGRSGSGDTASGNAVLALDVGTGRKLWEYSATPGAADDRRYMTFGVAASPAAVDADSDGYVERVYVGDVGGQLWKFDVAAGDTRAWTGKRLFAPAAPSLAFAISDAPALTFDHLHKLWLFFGTGTSDDPNAASEGRFYGIKDDTDMANGAAIQDSDPRLKDVTTANVTASHGWYVVLRDRREVPVGAASVFNGTVLFSTFTPDGAGVCNPGGGTTKLYAVAPSTGLARIDFTAGTPLTAPTATSRRFKHIGPGMGSTPIVVLTPPVAPGAPPTASVVTATSRQALVTTPIPAPAFLKQVRSWRER